MTHIGGLGLCLGDLWGLTCLGLKPGEFNMYVFLLCCVISCCCSCCSLFMLHLCWELVCVIVLFFFMLCLGLSCWHAFLFSLLCPLRAHPPHVVRQANCCSPAADYSSLSPTPSNMLVCIDLVWLDCLAEVLFVFMCMCMCVCVCVSV